MEDAPTEYDLPKIWVKLAHAYMADTMLSSSSPPCLAWRAWERGYPPQRINPLKASGLVLID